MYKMIVEFDDKQVFIIIISSIEYSFIIFTATQLILKLLQL